MRDGSYYEVKLSKGVTVTTATYTLRLVNVEEQVDAYTLFDAEDSMEAIIIAMTVISRRCEQGIHGAHTLFDCEEKIIAISDFLDFLGCPKPEYDPSRP